VRTALNVQHSDGTLIITQGSPEGGTRKTVNFCIEHRKLMFIVDLHHKLETPAFAAWVREHNIRVLNVAGSRESKHSGIGKQTERILAELLAALQPAPQCSVGDDA
jgi:hypothetical protein